VTILLIWCILLGALLGRFFTGLVLVPACALVLAAVVFRFADGEHGLLRPFLEFALLNATLQIGYVSGLLSHCIPHKSQRRGKLARARPLPRH
jgi:hypothetical protein